MYCPPSPERLPVPGQLMPWDGPHVVAQPGRYVAKAHVLGGKYVDGVEHIDDAHLFIYVGSWIAASEVCHVICLPCN